MMNNLVWDDTRADELATDLYWKTVGFIESFNIDIDAYRVASAVERAALQAFKEQGIGDPNGDWN